MSHRNTQPLVLVTDDDASIRNVLSEILKFEGYQTVEASNGTECLDLAEKLQPNLILLDLKMPGIGGEKTLEFLKMKHPEIPVVMLSGEGDIITAVEMLHKGAFHFLPKPADLDFVLKVVRRAINFGGAPVPVLPGKQPSSHGGSPKTKDFANLLGTSPQMRKITADLMRIAQFDNLRVLFTGETGTGKTHAAQLLHNLSQRKKEDFLTVNCGAIPHDLLESELFGWVKGAHNLATSDRPGFFRAANKGTLFLDEIATMEFRAQQRLLTVLDNNEVRPLGSDKTFPVDVRLISATNVDIMEEIREKRFRKDLYERVAQFVIHFPPLRERPEDIEPLIQHFNQYFSEKFKKPMLDFSPASVKLLQSLPWEGNIRELQSAIKCLMIFCENSVKPADVEQYVKAVGV